MIAPTIALLFGVNVFSTDLSIKAAHEDLQQGQGQTAVIFVSNKERIKIQSIEITPFNNLIQQNSILVADNFSANSIDERDERADPVIAENLSGPGTEEDSDGAKAFAKTSAEIDETYSHNRLRGTDPDEIAQKIFDEQLKK